MLISQASISYILAGESDSVGVDARKPGQSILHFDKDECFCRYQVYITPQNYHLDMKNDHIDIIADIDSGEDV